ncbi:DUF3644 domain-containing protein [Demequina sp.]|uniref:DUF3644 domain-containing protein n=1 Tax=Demequina sp. TaxID=2050685 RepID=UPI003D0BE27E
MGRPPRWQATLDAAVDEACLAVRLFNDPAEVRSFEGFAIHMHLAWLYLLHAELIRDGEDFRYWDPQHKRRLLRVDGEPKRWELDRCMSARWPDVNDPVRANLSLFIRLRNRLEHRHARSDAPLTLSLAGHAHALLLNFEEELTHEFGHDRTLAHRLRMPVFIGAFSVRGEEALREVKATLPPDIAGFVTEYESGLEKKVRSDPRYEFRLRATLDTAEKGPNTVAFQFTRFEDLTEDERLVIEGLGRTGRVVVRTRKQPVSGAGRLMPAAALPLKCRRALSSSSGNTTSRTRGSVSRCDPSPAPRTRTSQIQTGASTTSPPEPTAIPEAM